jgi:hypothetical protein
VMDPDNPTRKDTYRRIMIGMVLNPWLIIYRLITEEIYVTIVSPWLDLHHLHHSSVFQLYCRGVFHASSCIAIRVNQTASCFAWLILQPWRWRQLVPLKLRLASNRPHSIISQKI